MRQEIKLTESRQTRAPDDQGWHSPTSAGGQTSSQKHRYDKSCSHCEMGKQKILDVITMKTLVFVTLSTILVCCFYFGGFTLAVWWEVRYHKKHRGELEEAV